MMCILFKFKGGAVIHWCNHLEDKGRLEQEDRDKLRSKNLHESN